MLRRFVALLVIAAVVGCEERPTHKGPDVVRVPEGFIHDPGMSGGRNLFPDRRQVLQRGYTTAAIMDDDHSTIMITEYDGPTTAAQLADAIRAEQERYQYADYSAIEKLVIDRQEAWGWMQTQPKAPAPVRTMNYRVVVSYPEASYVVEFFTTHARFLDHPERLKDAVTSFRVRG